MRLLIVSTMFGPDLWGGSEELWRATAEMAVRDGQQVAVSVRRRGGLPAQLRELQKEGIQIIERRDDYGRIARLRRRAGLAPDRRVLARLRPDVVLMSHGDAFDVLADPGVIEATAAWCVEHEVPFMSLVHAADHSRLINHSGRRTAASFLNSAASVAFVSAGNRDAVRRQINEPLQHAIVIGNPIRDVGLQPWPRAECLRLAAVGRLDVKTKGQDVLLGALAQLTDVPWRLSFYGEGKDEACLRNTASTLGLTDRVRFRGYRDISAIWAEEQVFVSCSHVEGMAMAAVEAMLAGRPVVSADVGGIREWVVDGSEGFIIEKTEKEAATAVLRRVLDEPGLFEMGLRARERAVRQVDPDPARSLLRRLLDLAIGQPSSKM